MHLKNLKKAVLKKMSKRFVCVVTAVLAFLLCTACGKTPQVEVPEPEESQLRSICQLSVMEGYFHNVYQYEEKDAEKFLWMHKDKKFWIEYTGVARYGLDASKIKMDVTGKQVTITIPKAELMYCKVESSSLDDSSYIVEKDSAKVTAEDAKEALTGCQKELKKTAQNYEPLLTLAQQQAQQLMSDYIRNLVSATGSDAEQYTIDWIYLDD